MTKTPVLRIALPTPLRRLFDYLPPQGVDLSRFQPGVRVRVPFQSRVLVGVVVGVAASSTMGEGRLKRAEALLDEAPILPQDVQKLCEWASGYYHTGLGEVMAAAMPVALRKGQAPEAKPEKRKALPAPESEVPVLNADQSTAVEAILNAKDRFQVFLLDGVTGSGKTEVYLRVIERYLAAKQQVLILVPEISLTPQTVDRFRARFQVAVAPLHSGLSEQARLRTWLAARTGEACVVIGTRSAVFTPFKHLGLIIVDEEHDASFKQHDRFRYHARDVAVMRAHQLSIPIVLGSATPSLESYLNVTRERYQHLLLNERAGSALMPGYQVINVTNQSMEAGVSPALKAAMTETLAANQQVMLFLNRRGFAPVYYCESCGWIADCDRCDAHLVYHRSPPRLHCHHCDAKRALPTICGECHQATVKPIGLGTQRLEEYLQQAFPHVPIIRVDRDSTRKKGAMEALLKAVHAHPSAILLGTQMLAKGHHFPNVTLVGVVDADGGLFSPDFRSAETMGQLLMQVAGRAGRAEKAGRVLIQTRHPDHPWLTALLQQGYRAFAMGLLREREAAQLPPYAHLGLIRAEAHDEKKAIDFLNELKASVAQVASSVSVLGPIPQTMGKRRGLHGQVLYLKSEKRPLLQSVLKHVVDRLEEKPQALRVRWVLDVDPVEGA